jgi:hypothetical protein
MKRVEKVKNIPKLRKKGNIENIYEVMKYTCNTQT